MLMLRINPALAGLLPAMPLFATIGAHSMDLREEMDTNYKKEPFSANPENKTGTIRPWIEEC